MAAPGPGRSVSDDGAKFCGLIILVTAGYGAAWWATLRLIARRADAAP